MLSSISRLTRVPPGLALTVTHVSGLSSVGGIIACVSGRRGYYYSQQVGGPGLFDLNFVVITTSRQIQKHRQEKGRMRTCVSPRCPSMYVYSLKKSIMFMQLPNIILFFEL